MKGDFPRLSELTVAEDEQPFAFVDIRTIQADGLTQPHARDCKQSNQG